MLRQLLELYSLLTPEQRSRFLRLQILVVLMSVAEILSVVSIAPFMALVGDMNQLDEPGTLGDIFRASGIATPSQFLLWVGIFVLSVLTASAVLSMFTTWRLSLYGNVVGAQLSDRLYRHYLHRPWLFHAGGSSSQLTNQIAQECMRVTTQVINPLMLMNAKLVLAVLMSVAILLFNPFVAIIGLAVFSIGYMVLFRIVRVRLAANGNEMTQAQQLRFKLMGEGFGGIKDVLVLGRQNHLVEQFSGSSARLARAMGSNSALAQVPRYAMELVAFGSVISLVLYLLAAHRGNLGTLLPLLSIYALAGFKLLPAFQQVYKSLSQIRGNMAAYESLREDLVASAGVEAAAEDHGAERAHLRPERSIELRQVSFTYPGKSEPALRELSLEIPVNQVIGLVGASGSGKSTIIDLLLGLIDPQEGKVLVDGKPLGVEGHRRAWQNSLGFVPQTIFLSDCSIRENIAFGLPPEDIDDERVEQAATMAHLDEVLEGLPDGLDTRVGERGVQLSGGQRQRIGIARALYDNAEVLILDEATSALDGITEQRIMEAIQEFAGQKTIIMIAHRLATVRQCDRIYLIAEGEVMDEGSYDDLSSRNALFRRMSEHA